MFLHVDLNQFLEIVIFSSMSKLLCKKFKLKLSCPDKFEHSVVRVGFRLSADSFKLCNLVMINLNFVKKRGPLTRAKKLAWQSSRLAPFVWVPAWLLMLVAFFSCLFHYTDGSESRWRDPWITASMIMAELKLSPTVKKQQAQVEQRRTNSVIGHFLGSRDQRRGEGKSEPSMEPSKNNWNCKVKQKWMSM